MCALCRGSRTQHYKLHSSAGYFLRREARLRKRAEEQAAKEREAPQQRKTDANDEDTNCVIS